MLNDKDDAERIILGLIICGYSQVEAEQILVLYGIEGGFSRLDQELIKTLQQRYNLSEADAQQYFDSKGLIKILEELQSQPPPPSNTDTQQSYQSAPNYETSDSNYKDNYGDNNEVRSESSVNKSTENSLNKIVVGMIGGAICGTLTLAVVLMITSKVNFIPIRRETTVIEIISIGSIFGAINGILIGITYANFGKYLDNGSYTIFKFGTIGLFFGLILTVISFLCRDYVFVFGDVNRPLLEYVLSELVAGLFIGICLGMIYRIKQI